MDKLRALTVFRRVVELGSFKAAADDLNLSKAAVSKNIYELEDYLQSPLIQRTTRKLHVTDQGKSYYQQICQVLDSLAQADLSVLESTDSLKGSLKISVPMSLGLVEINPLICAFMQQHPALAIELLMTDHYIDLMEQGVDIAVRGGATLADSSLRSRKLTDIKRVLCASADYLRRSPPLHSPADLSQHQCLVYSLSSSARRWSFKKQLQQQDVELPVSRYTVNNGLALAQTAKLGHGIALLPEYFVKQALAQGELQQVLPDWQTEQHSLYIIYPYHKEQSQKVRAFIDFMLLHYSQI
ncbi:LysR family transcriptional regulator [Rheinheimera tangshanensis]|uniref:LysR family transcriptional regulator n=1 Tax=Rheinheimera tangshanensis TaxID=400153 RepID=A0A5C8LWT1_9GAMM|nr:LysR family transcriptional regulator [Rheinheimera tangshanensis]TXK80834.1 LysR family transcriptional regulator [Rheinheimera tangshanensis]GGM63158.1 transcriptional regulator [Rheinheimera tangshanensis]